jgi:cytochrome oxidase Cu insertion factor (SCO1/SenC/PrrC family)
MHGSAQVGVASRSAPRSRGSRSAALAAVVALCATLCACTSHTPTSTAASQTPTTGSVVDVAVPAAVANLDLVDQSGQRVTLASLRGKTVVLADFLSLCQEVCPLTTANLRSVVDAVRRAGMTGDVQVLEVTVDPQRDRPARLKAYQHLFGAEPNWSFATGRASDVAALWKWFGVAYSRTEEPAGPPPRDWLTGRPLTYDVDHQDVVFVLGSDGNERWFVDGMPNSSGSAAPPAPLQTFLNADGRHNQTAPADPSWTAADVEQALSYVTGQPIG